MKWDEVELRSPSFDRFPFYYTSIFMILQPLGSGYHEIKVNELEPLRGTYRGPVGHGIAKI